MARTHGDLVGEFFADLSSDDIDALMRAAREDQGLGKKGDRQRRAAMSAANPVTLPLAGDTARHFRFAVDGKVATITLDRRTRRTRSPFESYAEIVDLFRAAAKTKV